MDITDQERDTILAALRFWQQWQGAAIPEEILDIATNGDAHSLMDAADIDALCEKIVGD